MKISRQVVKSNLFVLFLEETSACKNHFDFVWPLVFLILFKLHTTDFQRVKLLRGVYNSVEDIDLFIGMTLEKPSDENNLAGDTFLCLIGDQFARLKWGDRYFYDLSNQEGSLNQCNIPILFFISMF